MVELVTPFTMLIWLEGPTYEIRRLGTSAGKGTFSAVPPFKVRDNVAVSPSGMVLLSRAAEKVAAETANAAPA
jgi:hypothetical protein